MVVSRPFLSPLTGVIKMTYVLPNFKAKKALQIALTAGEQVEVLEPGLGTVPKDGRVYLEGPHYPAPHTWYGVGEMIDGKLVSVK